MPDQKLSINSNLTAQSETKVIRCDWAETDPIFFDYHDKEWCVPCYDSQKIFSMLCLELMQAGLSWRTILVKREALEFHFANFEPKKVAKFDEEKVQALLCETSIIRNQAKIRAVINNAQKFLELDQQKIEFSKWIWQVTEDAKPIVNRWHKQERVPTKTPLAEKLTTQLKKAGFKFIGPTIVYSFMQAIGMVNDHLVNCQFRNAQ